MRRLAKFQRLIDPGRIGLLFDAVATLGWIRIGLALTTYARMHARVERRAARAKRETSCHAAAQRMQPDSIVRMLDRASRAIPGGHNCLVRALTAKDLMSRRGIPSVLHIGVTRDDARGVEAHAWLEWQGRVLVGRVENLARFKPFPLMEKGLS
jgi:hypothetical protein